MITHKYKKKTDQHPSNMAASIFVLHALPRAVERGKKSFWVPLSLKISASWSMLHTLEMPKFRFDVICLFISLLRNS